MTRILSIQEFEEAFPDEIACRAYFAKTRWPNGFKCPRCGFTRYTYVSTRNVFQCSACSYQCSLIVGTLFQDTKLPLRTWFWAIYFLVTIKKGISAMELQRKLGLGSYDTAWHMHAKIQHALKDEDAPLLRGIVEADETLYGPNKGEPGRSTSKAVIAVAVEDRGVYAGNLAIKHVPNASGDCLNSFVGENISPDSIINTDGWSGYSELESMGYNHESIKLDGPTDASEKLPWVHIVISNLKRVLNGTYAGVSRKHLNKYLQIFAFRLNHRRRLGSAMSEAIQRLVQSIPITYYQLSTEISG